MDPTQISCRVFFPIGVFPAHGLNVIKVVV